MYLYNKNHSIESITINGWSEMYVVVHRIRPFEVCSVPVVEGRTNKKRIKSIHFNSSSLFRN